MKTGTFSILTHKPIALDSPDHLHPTGAKYDNSSNPAFNRKLYSLIPVDRLTVLDIGCSGGGFVKSLLGDGAVAVGIEGSDYSLLNQRAEWTTIPGNLFTADATDPFQVLVNSEPALFSVITAWEFMEHISERDLAAVLSNVDRHLTPDGLFIISVTTVSGPGSDGVEMHQTVQPESWWNNLFVELGWRRQVVLEKFFEQDWVRSGGNSFSAVLKRKDDDINGVWVE